MAKWRWRRDTCVFRMAHFNFRHMKSATLQRSKSPSYGKK
jgi:hypothetical protein